MLSKFKKLFRASRSFSISSHSSPPKDLKETKDLHSSQEDKKGAEGKKKEGKEKGKRKTSQPVTQDISGDVVETQNQDNSYFEEVEIVENEFNAENEDEHNEEGNEEEESSEDVVIEDDSDIDDSFVGELVMDKEEKSNSFSCLSPSEIVEYQEKEVAEIADLLSVPASTSASLLRHFHWKRERFLTKYLENPQQVCQSAGVPYVPNSGAKLRSLSSSGSKNGANPASCSICGDDELDSTNSSFLSCNHVFCNECWGSHLSMKINDGEPEIHCPHYKCNIHVPDFFIKKLVPPSVFEKYLRFVTKNFVKENDTVRWCPTPGCSHAITFDQTNSTTDSAVVQCVCGYQFCFRCHHESHAPATCEHMKLWDKESEVFNWRAINCRECPKCNVSVEKNGGCNHMTCQQCKFEWCWVCLRPWKGHADFFNCDKAEKDKLNEGKRKSRRKKMEEEREKKQVAMKRYLSYRERFEHHEEAQKAEGELRTNAATKMQSLQDVYTKPEVQFIDKAVYELQECRIVMKYTYVFAYYVFADAPVAGEGSPSLAKSPAKDLFELLQSELEKTIDRLLDVIESLLKRPDAEMLALKLEAINHTSLARTKRENLLRAVARDPLFGND